MKRILLLVLICFSFASCLKDEHTGTHEFVPVVEVEGEEEMRLGETLEIQVDFIRPTNCHAFYDFHEEKYNTFDTYIAVKTQLTDTANCELNPVHQIVTYYFTPTEVGEHKLRFWNSYNNGSEDNYLVHTVNVIQP